MEEQAARSTYFRQLSSYLIPQTSQNRQTNIVINCLALRSEVIMHNASIVKNKQLHFHLRAHLSCFLGTRRSRTLPAWGFLFGFNVISVNPYFFSGNKYFSKYFHPHLLFVGDFHRWKIVAVSDHQSRVLAQNLLRPDAFLIFRSNCVRWTNGYFNFRNFSDSQSRISRHNIFHLGNKRFRSWSWKSARPLSSSSVEVLPI
jgi:hypothetical protein